VTFTDIWRDYKQYRQAYYYHQIVLKPKDIIQKQIELTPVPNLDNYSTWKTLVWIYENRDGHRFLGPTDVFCKLVYFWILTLIYLCVHYPVEWYYGWDDPMDLENEGSVEVDAESTLRRLKYKRKISNWQ
jgi:hypothetical protein